MIPHLKVFMPKNYDDIIHLGINIELLLRIETNLKLNLISQENKKTLIPQNEIELPEVHFLRIEGQTS